MKTAYRICGTLIVLLCLFFCSLSISKAQQDKEDVVATKTAANAQIARYKEQAQSIAVETKAMLDEQISKAKQQLQEQPSASTYFIIQIFLSVLLLLALTFGVLLFRPDSNLTAQLIGASALVTLVTYFMSPNNTRVSYGDMATGTSVLLSGIPVVIAGLFALLAAKRNTTSRVIIQLN